MRYSFVAGIYRQSAPAPVRLDNTTTIKRHSFLLKADIRDSKFMHTTQAGEPGSQEFHQPFDGPIPECEDVQAAETDNSDTRLRMTPDDQMSVRWFDETILSSVADAIVVVDSSAKILYVNKAALDLTGFKKEELIGEWADALSEDSLFFSETVFTQLSVCNSASGIETLFFRKGGTSFPVSLSASRVQDPKSDKTIIVCSAQDNTRRKRLEAEFRIISEISHGVTTTPNLDELLRLIHRAIGRILYAENCFVALLNSETGMLHMQFFVDKYDPPPPPLEVGRGLTAYVFRKGHSMLMTSEVVNRLIEQGEVESVGTDSPIWLGVPLRTPAGIIGVLVVQHYEDADAYCQQDVEFLNSVGDQIALAIERKRAEDALRQSDERFQLVTQATNDAVWDWNLETNDIWWNEGFQKLFGYSAEEVGNTIESWTTRIHPEDLERVDRVIHECIDNGQQKWADEYRFMRKDGSYAYVTDRGYVVYDAAQKPVRMLGSMMDVTEHKNAENQLQLFNEKLQQSNRELQDFAYVASHDLQEPLRKVQAFADRLSSKYAAALDGGGLDYLERMRGAAERMQKLIQDLLTFSRVSTKAQPFVAVNLDQITREVLSDLEVSIEQAGAAVEVSELPMLQADPLQMRQLMQNLIGNALKFRLPDRQPVIKIFGRHAKTINRGRMRTDAWEISVSDNGIGFEEKYLDRIFTVFQRLHGRTEYEGSGVGLAVCRKIAERHNGRITAKSKPGEGATFTVTLPINQNELEGNQNG
jgi:PAS domain S-box-containing protein